MERQCDCKKGHIMRDDLSDLFAICDLTYIFALFSLTSACKTTTFVFDLD